MTSRRRKLGMIAVLIAGVATVSLAALGGATAQSTAPLIRHAGSMPAGAIAYVEARDLSSLLGVWLASPIRAKYLESASYRSFRRSRLFMKLSDRIRDLEQGFGVELSDTLLAELAGGSSAVAVYDPGKLEVLLVTEVSSQKAMASRLFAQSSSFEQRQTAKGQPYYSREVVSDGGSLVQRIAFGYAADKLWVGTNESLVAEAIDGPSGGGLGTAVAETVRAASDLNTAHDVVIWADMQRAVRSRYFSLYWIHRNSRELEELQSGLFDVEISAAGVRERRWFVRKNAPAAESAGGGTGIADLAALAPADAQYVEARSMDARMPAVLAETMFGPSRTGRTTADVRASRVDNPFELDDEGSNRRPAGGRYRYLDDRFDRDVDDPVATIRAKTAVAVTPATPSLEERLAPMLAAASPVRYAVYGSIRLPEGKLFAGFERAVVVELGSPDRFDRGAFETLAREEFARRFLVGGQPSRVSWVDVDGARGLAGALISQGGAYRLAGRFLIVARDAAQCATIAARVESAAAPASSLPGATVRVAEVRLSTASGPFRRLTGLLDARDSNALDQEIAAEGGEADALRRPVLFFSENLASLLNVVSQVTTVRITTTEDGVLLRELVEYRTGS
ncbi:MAG: hypothetical protein IT175_17685 [Acidobacteria bacterium]|nr:hypothetical protein [Acidobacteriota bacterium]